MIKMVYCLRRLPGMSREEFQRYWREKHGPLVRKHAATLRIRRYVQVHTGYDELNANFQSTHGSPEPYDGVAELWWDSLDDRVQATPSPERQRAGAELFEDEKKFIDHSRSPAWFADEHVFVDG
jgi:uncharacterized protein (TIGR02118 family)